MNDTPTQTIADALLLLSLGNGNEIGKDAAERLMKLERENAALRSAAVEVCALARVWVTVWGDKLSDASLLRFTELEEEILRRAQP